MGGCGVLVQVWDLGSGACTQTLHAAHSNVVMQLLLWEVRFWRFCTHDPGFNM